MLKKLILRVLVCFSLKRERERKKEKEKKKERKKETE